MIERGKYFNINKNERHCPMCKTGQNFNKKMPESKNLMKEVLPKQGLLYQEDMPTVVLCKPKILPLKSVTLEKLEKMQKEAQDTVRQQEKETSLNDDMFAGI